MARGAVELVVGEPKNARVQVILKKKASLLIVAVVALFVILPAPSCASSLSQRPEMFVREPPAALHARPADSVVRPLAVGVCVVVAVRGILISDSAPRAQTLFVAVIVVPPAVPPTPTEARTLPHLIGASGCPGSMSQTAANHLISRVSSKPSAPPNASYPIVHRPSFCFRKHATAGGRDVAPPVIAVIVGDVPVGHRTRANRVFGNAGASKSKISSTRALCSLPSAGK